MLDHTIPENPFHQWIDLAQPRLGSRVVYATDDFFGAKERLIDAREPVFIPDKYDDHGKWMDGWESRRKRDPGHDCCIVQLGVPGLIRGCDISTRFFSGNHPPCASLDGCVSDKEIPAEDEWGEICPGVNLQADAHHFHAIHGEREYTHVRLNIYPDGGVARLRLYGEIRPDWGQVKDTDVIDLLALENGGRALMCNNEHFGSMRNLNAPGRGVNMGDGWETARRRGPGHDWVILRLGCPGVIQRVEIDTAHFKGNYPDRASIQAALVDVDEPVLGDLETASESWPLLLPECKLEMDKQHLFSDEVQAHQAVSHVRLNIFPDGGVSRLRLFGTIRRGR